MHTEWATTRDVESALAMLTSMFPAERVPIDATVIDTWWRDLKRFHGVVVLEAASTFDGERFPNRVQFFERCQITARARIRAQAEQHAAEQQSFEVARPVDRETGRALVEIMREAIDVVEPVKHVRHDGHANPDCPACVDHGTRVELIAAEADRLMRERGFVAIGDTTYRCPECRDQGAVILVESSSDGPETTRPCSRCSPGAFVLWQAGHLRSGHTCSACSHPRKRQELVDALLAKAAPSHAAAF